jgi:hypothetical protein
MSSNNQMMICRACGRQERQKQKGMIGLELALWLGAVVTFVLLYPFGGLLGAVALGYSWWRRGAASRMAACPGCHRAGTLIPSDTPEGKRVAASYTTPPIIKR